MDHRHCVGPYLADGWRFGDAVVGSVYRVALPDEDHEAAARYVGCLGRPRGWSRPGGNVPISNAGAQQCRSICASRGYSHFGMECPMTTEVHCQCSNNENGGTAKGYEYCEGNGNPLVMDHRHCVGPYLADGWRFGDAVVGSVYRVALPDEDHEAAARYVGCLGRPRGWSRPGGNVPISNAGAQQCRSICASRGYSHFGMECPMTTEVHCQ